MKTRTLLIACLLPFLLQAKIVLALGEPAYISAQFHAGDVILADSRQVASLYVDSADFPGVLRAATNLQHDIEKVSGQLPLLQMEASKLHGQAVLIGTLGHSAVIDALVAAGKLDVAATAGQWDGFLMKVVSKPLPGVDSALVIVGANKRGTMFGIYDLSEQIGVSPWYWWADVPVHKAPALYVKGSLLNQQAPVIRYRGIFLNDEAPALSGWVKANYGNYNAGFYEHVFELLLRLKANFLWPAMWNNAFNADDADNMRLADEMGIVMSTSHHEPMMRAQKEWTWAKDADKGNGKWDYNSNAATLQKFWRGGVERNKGYESIITLGMRGDGDMPMSEQDDVALLQRIVKDQRQIIAETYAKPLTDIPQVWTLYKEVQGYYERGMRVADDITLLWSDDNWGQIRHLPTPEERSRAGGAGVYYHFDYVGGPRSYRWLNTNPIAKVWEQMNLAYEYDARKIWVVNVGDLKPMEFPIEYFLRLAWNPQAWPKERIAEFGELWAAREFGGRYSSEIAALVAAYSQHNNQRKPELLDAATYSQLNYREAERVVKEMRALLTQAEQINNALAPQYRDAFFQLVLHPIKASAIVMELYNAVALNQLYASQGRASTTAMASNANAWFAADAALKNEYHQLNNGKWDHFMDQPHIGYTTWDNPPQDLRPQVTQLAASSAGVDVGVVTEGSAAPWPTAAQLSLHFDQYGQHSRYVEIFRRSEAAADYSLTTDAPWLRLSQLKGDLANDARVEISVDWNKLQGASQSATIKVQGSHWQGPDISVSVSRPDPALLAGKQGFVEADGYIAIEAAAAIAAPERNGYQWQEIPLHGRTHSAMTPLPLAAVAGAYDKSFTNALEAPELSYPVIFTKAGAIEITALFSPSSPFVPGRGLRYAIALDNEPPQIVDILAGETEKSWETAVKDAIRPGVSHHSVAQAGLHMLHVSMVDTGVTLQKILINTGTLLPSYLGPEPSTWLAGKKTK